MIRTVIDWRRPRPAAPPVRLAQTGTKVTFVCWKWKPNGYRTSYTAEHVNVLKSMIALHGKRMEYRLICITDDPAGVECETFQIWDDHAALANPCGQTLPRCYRRLKIFNPETTRSIGIQDGERVVSIDLDVVICADLSKLFVRYPDSPFVGWKGMGWKNPHVYNGSLFMFSAGKMSFLWDEFDPVRSPQQSVQARYFGSDQGWMSYRLAGKYPGWGRQDGVFSYTSNLSIRGIRGPDGRALLPSTARIVSFNGRRKPWEAEVQEASPWIRDHWRVRQTV